MHAAANELGGDGCVGERGRCHDRRVNLAHKLAKIRRGSRARLPGNRFARLASGVNDRDELDLRHASGQPRVDSPEVPHADHR